VLTLIVMGGVLANPTKTMPRIFGPDAIFGFEWLQDYPYALPSLVNAFSLLLCTAVIWLFLREVRSWQSPSATESLLTGDRRRGTARIDSISDFIPVIALKNSFGAAKRSAIMTTGHQLVRMYLWKIKATHHQSL
jgi:hypothetical protein